MILVGWASWLLDKLNPQPTDKPETSASPNRNTINPNPIEQAWNGLSNSTGNLGTDAGEEAQKFWVDQILLEKEEIINFFFVGEGLGIYSRPLLVRF